MKNLLLIFSVLISSKFFSQDLTSKEGAPILPQAKDWGISIDATRLIKNATFNFASSTQAIMGKYFKNPTTAYRVGLRIGFNDWTTQEMEIDRLAATNTIVAFPAPQPMKQNTWKRSSTAFGVSFGIEKRRGQTRLQGIYGAEAGVFISTLKDKFSYGNALNANPSSPIPVTADDAMSSQLFGSANNIDTVPAIQGVQGAGRVIERKNGVSISIGGRVFIGAEYFFLPKMSLGGEFGWGLGFSQGGRTETTIEAIGQSNIQGSTAPSVKRTTIDGGRISSAWLDTDNSNIFGGASASLRLNLYF